MVGAVARLSARFAYTRDVLLLAKQLTSVAAACALSGLPMVLTACMALCLQTASMAAAPGVSGGHHASDAATAPAGHSHHGASTTAPQHPSASATTQSVSGGHLHAHCVNCCLADVVFAAGPRAERHDTPGVGTGSPIILASYPLVMPTLRATWPESPPVSPPSPTRLSVVLRI